MTEEQVFLEALERPTAAERAAYLDKVCGVRSEFRRQVEELLAAHFQSGEFLDRPLGQQLEDETAIPMTTPTIAETVFVPEGSIPAGGERGHEDDEPSGELRFLEPSKRNGSLGRLGHYEVLEVLGQGGFGIVLRAFDDMLQRVVALKVLAPSMAATSPARKRFLREARASARVRHENVVQVHAVEELPIPYLVMEFIAGETLQQRLDRKGPLEAGEIVSLGRQIAEGLAAAHATGLIHRDIKPGNILVEGGASERVKITDFGLARAADDASMTQSGMVAGTPMFMAPEQIQGALLDQRADLFSLGSVLYVMTCGRPPFRAATTFAVLKRVVEEEPRPIADLIPETPKWLCDIIARLHAKNPDDRYQTSREVADLLADCEQRLKTHTPPREFPHITRRSPATPSASPSASPRLSPGSSRWTAAAVLFLAIGGLAVCEMAGVTQLFRASAKRDVDREIEAKPVAAIESAPEGWAPLFNGQNLDGWETHPEQTGKWSVKDGVLIGSAQQSHLFTQRDDFANFHLRVEIKLNRGGDSGIRFRAPLALQRGKQRWQVISAGGYEAEFNKFGGASAQTGSVWRVNQGAPPNTLFRASDRTTTQPDEWHRYEVIADGNRFITKLDGSEIANCVDAERKYSQGRIALQCFSPQTIVQFRKLEIKELPASSPVAAASLPPEGEKPIAAQPAERRIEEVRKELVRLNPGFDGVLVPTIENGVVTRLSVNTDAIDDISPVRALSGLVYLDVRGTYPNKGKLSDLTPLAGMRLRELDCSSTQIADLRPLAGMPLTFLQFNHNPVSDLTPLVGMPLVTLGCAETQVSDFSPLKGMKIKTLGAQLLPVTDLSPLTGMPLTGLDLYHTVGVTSIEPLRGMPLEGLNLQDVPVTDLSPLSEMMTLRTLVLQGSEVSDLSPLRGLKLTDVFLNNPRCSDLSPLAGMPLSRLAIDGTSVSDLTPIKDAPLIEIRLTPKNISTGLDLLRSMPTLQTITTGGTEAWPAAEFWRRHEKGEFN